MHSPRCRRRAYKRPDAPIKPRQADRRRPRSINEILFPWRRRRPFNFRWRRHFFRLRTGRHATPPPREFFAAACTHAAPATVARTLRPPNVLGRRRRRWRERRCKFAGNFIDVGLRRRRRRRRSLSAPDGGSDGRRVGGGGGASCAGPLCARRQRKAQLNSATTRRA